MGVFNTGWVLCYGSVQHRVGFVLWECSTQGGFCVMGVFNTGWVLCYGSVQHRVGFVLWECSTQGSTRVSFMKKLQELLVQMMRTLNH